jgi:acetyl esterase
MSTDRFTLAQRIQRAFLVFLSRLPAPVLRLLAKPPINRAGDRMPPDVALLMKIAAAGEDYSDLPADEARATTERNLALFASRVTPCAVEEEL